MFLSLARVDDRRQVLLHLVDRQTAQAVVGAERDDEDANVALERPVEPAQAAGRRIARDAGIDDFERIAVLVHLLLQERRIGLALDEAQADRQAVAEGDDPWARDGAFGSAVVASRALAAADGDSGPTPKMNPHELTPILHALARMPAARATNIDNRSSASALVII